ncbi:DUF6891 domain-containing protein [Mycolicibacterium brisbanense]|uniref:DUF6891 domain-containing protein n=1 Tax=Mycolicibacterium brisbanense TaxID=146020 RepID=A0A117I6K1_9MYCO|nr:hypothetical protein [Mycolicibacterium brisbanense]MCV7157586.1 hypothetical protein [Mycolicibacterium brisbanense]GAS90227.1 uncharacterized protein RMCB_4323 [Mycolicibacterium brisbanense]
MRILDWDTGDLDELSGFIRTRLVAGFWEFDELLDWVTAWVDDSGVVTPEEATALLQSMWGQRLSEQAAWQDTGDYGRLQYLFTQLESEGILARMCFSCCTTCATHDIDDERTPNPDPNDWYRFREWAYTFFHEQDAVRLGDPDPVLYLGYSAFRPHPALPQALMRAAAAGDTSAAEEMTDRTETLLGERIVLLANHYGLATTWSGSRHDRIEVNVREWRKPLPGQ